jgi:hypothetical protein
MQLQKNNVKQVEIVWKTMLKVLINIFRCGKPRFSCRKLCGNSGKIIFFHIVETVD